MADNFLPLKETNLRGQVGPLVPKHGSPINKIVLLIKLIIIFYFQTTEFEERSPAQAFRCTQVRCEEN